MRLNIREIPSDGLQVTWTKDDLRKTFKEFESITVRAFLLPIGGGFDVSGEVEAQIPLDCSFCANSLPIPVKEKFHEVFLLAKPSMIKSKKRSSQEDEDEVVVDPSALDEIYIEGNELDLAPLVRDTIELTLPLQPKCLQKGAPQGSPECKADWDYESYFKKHEDTPLVSPFDALKSLKNLKKN